MRQKQKRVALFNKSTLRYRSQHIKSIGTCVIKVKHWKIRVDLEALKVSHSKGKQDKYNIFT